MVELTDSAEECDVEERRVRVDELKRKQLDDQHVVVLSLCSMILYNDPPTLTTCTRYFTLLTKITVHTPSPYQQQANTTTKARTHRSYTQ